jgi:LysR family transcriptional regulator, glycine cleavage system transcriptional activator
MARRLPSLNALRAFEAAARNESFTLAAQELFVTHAAVSRHMRDLEEWLGVQLFHRTGRGVKLTDAGARYGRELTPLFDRFAAVTRDVMMSGKTRTLKVSVEPSIASRWLVPRLGRFNELHPDIELSVDPENRLVDFHTEDADLGIRYGPGNWRDVEALKLSDVEVFPVCSPGLIAGHSDFKPSDLADYDLLHESRKEWWADWLAAAKVEGVEGWRGTVFQNHLAIEAAEAGQGFALGDQILCTDSLLEGWLVRPFEIDIRETFSYHIVRAKGTRESPPAQAFRAWLVGEMTETNRKFAQIKADGRSKAKP